MSMATIPANCTPDEFEQLVRRLGGEPSMRAGRHRWAHAPGWVLRYSPDTTCVDASPLPVRTGGEGRRAAMARLGNAIRSRDDRPDWPHLATCLWLAASVIGVWVLLIWAGHLIGLF